MGCSLQGWWAWGSLREVPSDLPLRPWRDRKQACEREAGLGGVEAGEAAEVVLGDSAGSRSTRKVARRHWGLIRCEVW